MADSNTRSSSNPNFIPDISSDTIYFGLDENVCLTDVVNSKADANHSHTEYATQSDLESLESAIDTKADSLHSHTEYASISHASDTELHITEAERNNWNAKSNFSGSYTDLTNKPSIPSIDGLATEDYVDAQINAIDIPSALSDLTGDSMHRTVTDGEKTTWNAKSNFSGSYNDLTNKPTIPSAYTHPSYTAKSSGLYKVTVDTTGHVSAATSVTKADITALGIPASDTNTTYSAATSSAAGLMSASDKSKLDGIASGANAYTLPTATSTVLGGVKTGSNITNSGGTISLTKTNITAALGYTPPTTNTTYSAATTSTAGLMSAADKSKLDGISADNFMTKTDPTGSGSISIGRKSNTTVGDTSIAMGYNAEASAKGSVAIGTSYTSSSGATASGRHSTAIGSLATASGFRSTAVGYGVTASGEQSVAVGGNGTTASGDYSIAMGRGQTASGDYSFAAGEHSSATEEASVAIGYYLRAKNLQCVVGKLNAEVSGPATVDTQDSNNADAIFMVGYGRYNNSNYRANAFRISSGGTCFGTTAFVASGADFAELFEWADGNPNNEDRRGLFVALDGEKIKLANTGDDYIGVVSGSQAFIGNSASEEWQGKYMTDVFGERLAQEVEIPAKIDDETGEVITPATTTTQYILNPDYDPEQNYVMRENRKEWGIVGLVGQIIMIDDGTCVVGGRIEPSANGVGTTSTSGYRVMARVDENHVKVLVK